MQLVIICYYILGSIVCSNGIKEEEEMGRKFEIYPDTVLVVNATSSSGSTGKSWEDLYKKIKEVFGRTPPEIVFTKMAGDGTAITREFLKKGFKKIVAISGDG